jgi:uncharacterized integral membrane protein
MPENQESTPYEKDLELLRSLHASGEIDDAEANRRKARLDLLHLGETGRHLYSDEVFGQAEGSVGHFVRSGNRFVDADTGQVSRTPQMEQSASGALTNFALLARRSSSRQYEGAEQAKFAASFLIRAGWTAVAVSAIGGLILIFYQDPYAHSYDDWWTRHPLGLVGFVSFVIGTIQALAVVMISSYIQSQIAFQAHLGGVLTQLQSARPEDLE